ncbi:trimeric intracellular cation channel family protein [Sphingomonas sp. AP4-R1]|nr:trimeric intracellular cation channel family protein [Sphingomonas sp. AP4-R1]
MIGPNAVSPVLHLLSIAGLTVFAISGALAAARQRLDIIAGGFFAVVTATGGGTVRDVLIDEPVFWIRDWSPVVICALATVAVWLVPLHRWPAKALDWFDAAGLSAFAVFGTAKALGVGVSPLPAVVMGVVTACLGGIIRDMVAGVPSIMLRNELYVTAALAAGLAFVGLLHTGMGYGWASLISAAVGFALRGAGIRWKLALPRHRG